jgi:SAM-dependent methyltransferase
MRVLDVAAGEGNTALAAARRGATVIAVDITPAQVRRGRIRTEAEGAMVRWAEADEDRLPFRDVSFDCALCTFGIEGPLDAAVDEMFRVVRRGGVVGFTEWTGEGVVGALWEPLSGFASPKMEQQETDDWGNEDHVRSRLSKHASLIDLRRQVLQGRFESWTGSVPISGRTTPRSEPWMRCSLPTSGVSSDRSSVDSSPTGTWQPTVVWSSN